MSRRRSRNNCARGPLQSVPINLIPFSIGPIEFHWSCSRLSIPHNSYQKSGGIIANEETRPGSSRFRAHRTLEEQTKKITYAWIKNGVSRMISTKTSDGTLNQIRCDSRLKDRRTARGNPITDAAQNRIVEMNPLRRTCQFEMRTVMSNCMGRNRALHGRRAVANRSNLRVTVPSAYTSGSTVRRLRPRFQWAGMYC